MKISRTRWGSLCAAGLALFLGGCGSGGQARVVPTAIDPAAAGKAAIQAYDTDGDGSISGAELDKCPALKSALSRFDTNGDGKVTADTIAARIEKWQITKVAIMPLLPLAVELDGKPLEGALVTCDPEPFL